MHYLNVPIEDGLWDALHRAKQKYNCNWSELFTLMLKNMPAK